MINGEILCQRLGSSPEYLFRNKLNANYSDMCSYIKRRKGVYAKRMLFEIIELIWDNIEHISSLSKEDQYMVMACVKLAKSERYDPAISLFKTEEYEILNENYINCR